MDAEKFFKTLYYDIWQGHDLSKFDKYYTKHAEEIIDVADDNKQPIELHLRYDDIVEQAKWQKANYKDITIHIKKAVSEGNHLSVHFYSGSIDKHTGELKHRCVCGIWRLNKDHQIEKVWAVVTPYYAASFPVDS